MFPMCDNLVIHVLARSHYLAAFVMTVAPSQLVDAWVTPWYHVTSKIPIEVPDHIRLPFEAVLPEDLLDDLAAENRAAEGETGTSI